MAKSRPIRVAADGVIRGSPDYSTHVLAGRCETSFDISSLLNFATRQARQNPGLADEEISQQLRWILAIVEYRDFEEALGRYDAEGAVRTVRNALSRIERVPCIACQQEDNPRHHTH